MPITPLKRSWTCHWQKSYWRDDINAEFEPLTATGSNVFAAKGVRPGDRLYVVTISAGQLLFGARMTVEAVITRTQAVQRLDTDDLYEDAKWWAVGAPGLCTPLNLHRQLEPALTRRLWFVSPQGPPKRLKFVSETHLDGQTTRGVRQLTPDSAELLERVLAFSDGKGRSRTMRSISWENVAPGA